MTENETRDDESPSIMTETIAALVSAGAGLAIAGPGGALVAAAAQPALSMALQRAIEELAQLRRRSAEQMVSRAAVQLAAEPDTLVALALEDADAAHLLGEAIQVAARTVNQQKINGLARALANGLREDSARPDEEALIVAALAEVEAPHIKVLAQLGPEHSRTRTATGNLGARTPPRRGQSPLSLATSCTMSASVVRAVLSVLQRAGLAIPDDTAEVERNDKLIMELQREVSKLAELVVKPSKDGKISSSKRPRDLKRPGSPVNPGWVITPFGISCLEYLEGEQAEPAVGVTVENDD